jgi:hypothetical protein
VRRHSRVSNCAEIGETHPGANLEPTGASSCSVAAFEEPDGNEITPWKPGLRAENEKFVLEPADRPKLKPRTTQHFVKLGVMRSCLILSNGRESRCGCVGSRMENEKEEQPHPEVVETRTIWTDSLGFLWDNCQMNWDSAGNSQGQILFEVRTHKPTSPGPRSDTSRRGQNLESQSELSAINLQRESPARPTQWCHTASF